MNPPILVPRLETEALRGDLRPSKRSLRLIPCPGKRAVSRFGGGR